MFFRFSRAVKHGIIEYLRRIYDLNAQGQFDFHDGENAIRFSRRPSVRTYEEWEIRQAEAADTDPMDPSRALKTVDLKARAYPAVLINGVSGPLHEVSLTGVMPPTTATIPAEQGGHQKLVHELLDGGTPFGSFQAIDRSVKPNEVIVGGSAELTVSLTTVARSREEADSLADITLFWLASPLFKGLLWQKYGWFPIGGAALGGQSSVEDVATDFRLYTTDLSLNVRGDWQDRLVKLATIEKLVFDIELIDP